MPLRLQFLLKQNLLLGTPSEPQRRLPEAETSPRYWVIRTGDTASENPNAKEEIPGRAYRLGSPCRVRRDRYTRGSISSARRPRGHRRSGQ